MVGCEVVAQKGARARPMQALEDIEPPHGGKKRAGDERKIGRASTKVALDCIKQVLRVKVAALLVGGPGIATSKAAADLLHQRVELAQSPEVRLHLSLVLAVLMADDGVVRRRQCFEKRPHPVVVHNAVSDRGKVRHRRRRPVKVHAAVHLGRVQRPVRDADECLRAMSLVEHLVQCL